MLGQGEGRELAPGQAWQISILLLLSPEFEERAGHADALVCRQECARCAAARGDDRERPVVGDLRKPQPPILTRGLDPEGTHLGEAVEHLLRNPAVRVVLVAVDFLAREGLELLEECCRPILFLGVGRRRGVDEVEVEPSFEECFCEAAFFPFLLARLLGNFSGLEFACELLLFGHGVFRISLRSGEQIGLNLNSRMPQVRPTQPVPASARREPSVSEELHDLVVSGGGICFTDLHQSPHVIGLKEDETEDVG